MKHIKLIENSTDIEHKFYQDIFMSKLYSLNKVLYYFERYEIAATIIFEGYIKEKRLHTQVDVQCEDEVFRKVIEENIRKFRQPQF